MIILALDTTSEFGSVAVRRHGQLLVEKSIHSPEGFARLVFPAIDEVLKTAEVRFVEAQRARVRAAKHRKELAGFSGGALDSATVLRDCLDIDCFAAASGPGSFTGVRIGLAAIKGLAAAMGRPAIGISNLRALSSFGNSALRAAVLDARRGEVYAGVYNADLEPVMPEMVAPFESWRQMLDPSLAYEFVSQTDPPRPLAAAVALCAELDGLKGRWHDPADIDANYVRRSDAELYWKDPKPAERKGRGWAPPDIKGTR